MFLRQRLRHPPFPQLNRTHPNSIRDRECRKWKAEAPTSLVRRLEPSRGYRDEPVPPSGDTTKYSAATCESRFGRGASALLVGAACLTCPSVAGSTSFSTRPCGTFRMSSRRCCRVTRRGVRRKRTTLKTHCAYAERTRASDVSG